MKIRLGKIPYLRRLLPICRIHHIAYSYGYCIFPWLQWTVALVENSDIRFAPTKPGLLWHEVSHFDIVPCWMRWGVRLVNRAHYHNCTWTGIY